MPDYSRRSFLKFSLMGGASALFAGSFSKASTNAPGRNVLFLAVDDLRPDLGCYCAPIVKSPNIDALAARGTVFNRAYCQQAVCSPSRTSLLTGRRPDTTRIYDLQTHFRLTLPDVVTLPQYFKQHGYHARGFSKIYHGGLDDPRSWGVPHWRPGGPGYGKRETLEFLERERQRLRKEGGNLRTTVLQKDPETGIPLKVRRPRFRVRGPSWEDPDVPDNALPDGKTTDKAIEILLAAGGNRFFMAVGFLKPHLPFVAPKKYFDMYPLKDLSLADNPFAPKDCPQIALMNWGELRAYSDIPQKGPLSNEKALELIRGYLAATSYVDVQIGRILRELERSGLMENTVIVLWGDHGWQLGEHGLWCKHTNFEVATRSLLIASSPGQKNAGARTDALVEFVDIYPTLCDLCGLPIPEGLEGTSFAPVMDNPKRPWKTAAFSQYPRGRIMGYSMRTDRYRYTEWLDREKHAVARELYDHHNDPDENVNIAVRPENKELVAKLSKMLHAGWCAALPPRS